MITKRPPALAGGRLVSLDPLLESHKTNAQLILIAVVEKILYG